MKSPLLLFIIAIEAWICFFLIHNRYIPIGHDSLTYLFSQYYYLNNAIYSGEIPQWIPYVMQGVSGSLMYALQAGIFQNVSFLFAPLLKSFNFLPLFHLGMFFDQILLLTGVWLLSKRLYKHQYTIFFVAVTAIGSVIWESQAWFNFHFYYAIPLILYFLHRFGDTQRWRYIFLAGSLLALQTLGNAPYFITVTGLVIFLYFLFFSIQRLDEWKGFFSRMRWGMPFILSILGVVLSLFLAIFVFYYGSDQLAMYAFGREKTGGGGLSYFLNYGGQLDLFKWIECIVQVSPMLDYTLYFGIFAVFTFVFGIRPCIQQKQSQFLWVVVVLSLLSAGTLVAQLLYYSWPLMKLYRHLVLIVPVIKLFLIFIAGFGFEQIFFTAKSAPKKYTIIFDFLFVAIISSMAIFLITNANIKFVDQIDSLISVSQKWISGKWMPAIPVYIHDVDTSLLIQRLIKVGLLSIIISVGIVLCMRFSYQKMLAWICFILLSLHIYDLYSYKFSESLTRLVSIGGKAKYFDFTPMPFVKQRSNGAFSGQEREKLVKSLLPLSNGSPTVMHNAFLFHDEIGSSYPSSYWQKPLDQYMRAYWHQPQDQSNFPKGNHVFGTLDFPVKEPAAIKVSGLTEEKIQFFDEVLWVRDHTQMVQYLTSNTYQGDILLIQGRGQAQTLPRLDSYHRLKLPYQITRFDSNHLILSVFNPKSQNIWLLYSDVWSPFWKVRVNNQKQTVFKANLAYKAVELTPGKNDVHFYYYSWGIAFIQWFFSINALGCMIVVIYLLYRELRGI